MNHFWVYLWIIPLLATASPLERGIRAKAAGDFPLATKELAEAVKAEPKNIQAWYQYGTVLGWQNRFEEARAALDQGLAISPDDYDLRVMRARVIAWQGDYENASQEFSKLAGENPKDDDVATMQGRIAGWRGRNHEAEMHYNAILTRNPNHVDALTGLGDLARDKRLTEMASDFYRRALAIDPSPDIQQRLDQLQNEKLMRLEYGLTASSFTGSTKSDWWSAWTQLSYRSDWGNIWGRVEQGERFDKEDTQLEIGWENTLADGLLIRGLAGGSPDADWAPEYYLESGIHWLPALDWPNLVLEIRHAEYVPRVVQTARTGIDYDFGKGWGISARWIHQEFEGGTPTEGWILSIKKEYDSGYAWNIGTASGAESLDGQTLLPGSVLRSQTWFGGLRGPISDNWGWRADVEYEDVKNGVNRQGVSIGIHHKF